MADMDTEAFLAEQRAAEDKIRAEQDAALAAVKAACDTERKRKPEASEVYA